MQVCTVCYSVNSLDLAEIDRQSFCNFSGNAVHKEKRKIVFADEAGGKLCDVKTFENDRASFKGSSSDKQGKVSEIRSEAAITQMNSARKQTGAHFKASLLITES
ncbi:hypothetical protein NC651_007300 [Populus alba x Populus x berolinensis]|nr:hypothetical protein NC651_007300 [Populus alba x Populus x berolinensis]